MSWIVKSIPIKISDFKSGSYFTVSLLFFNFCSIISSFIVYRYVEPKNLGLWQSFILLDTYCTFLRLGIINGFNREYPYLIGQGNSILAKTYAASALYFTLLSILLLAGLAFVLLFFIKIFQNNLFIYFSVCLIISLNMYNTYLTSTFRANVEFVKLSHIQVINGILKLLSLLVVIHFGFKGYIARELFTLTIIVFITHEIRPIKNLVPRFNREIILNLLKVGFPIFTGSYIISVINTFPRLFLLKYGSLELIGIYTPLLAIIGGLSLIPDSVGTFLYPKMTYLWAKEKNLNSLWKRTLLTHFGMLIVGVPLIVFLMYLIPYIIDCYLPKYVELKSILIPGLLISLFITFKFGYTTLTITKSWFLIVIYILLFATFQVFSPFLLLSRMPILKAAIFGQLITSFLMIIVSLITNYLATHKK